MENKVLLFLAVAFYSFICKFSLISDAFIWFSFFIFALKIFNRELNFLAGARSVTFTIKNQCPYTVWPGTLTGAGTVLPSTGFELATGASISFDTTPSWSGRLWGRTLCSTDSTGTFSCATADCGTGEITCNGAGAKPPATLMEFTVAANGGLDFYDVSLVDGFNVPVSIVPQGGGQGCNSTSCPANVNAACPPDLAMKGSDGSVIGCKSACLAFNRPEFCCTGPYDSPATCKPTSYSLFFKNQCEQAYSYAFDDKTSTFTCAASKVYVITFCP